MSAGRFGLLCVLLFCVVAVYANLNASDRLAFAGKVNFAGRPLRQGMVLLYPEKGTEGPVIAMSVEGGQFHIGQSHGPIPGDYKVEIYELDANGLVTTIPKEFNINSTLKLSVPREWSFYAEFEL